MKVTVPVADIQGGELHAVRVNDQLTLAVFEFEGKFLAVDNKCPHRGAPLTDGEINGDLLICPLHHFKFNLRTSRCVMPKHLKLRTFPVSQEGGELSIDVGLDVERGVPRPA